MSEVIDMDHSFSTYLCRVVVVEQKRTNAYMGRGVDTLKDARILIKIDYLLCMYPAIFLFEEILHSILYQSCRRNLCSILS